MTTARCVIVFITLCLTGQTCIAAEQTKQHNTTQKTIAHHLPPTTAKVREAFKMQSNDLRHLMLQLYQCNQKDLLKSTKVSAEELVQWVFEGPFGWKFDAIRQAQSIDALSLSFSEKYQGDRVLPLITGLHTMLVQAYGGENEFRFTKTLLPKNLIDAARNIEITRWKLFNASNSVDYFNTDCTSNQTDEIENTLTTIITRTDQFAISNGYSNTEASNAHAVDFNVAEFIRF
jgi:hypothetical protein